MRDAERFTKMLKNITLASNTDMLLEKVNNWLIGNGYKVISKAALKRYPNAGEPYEKKGPPKQLWPWIAETHTKMFGKVV